MEAGPSEYAVGMLAGSGSDFMFVRYGPVGLVGIFLVGAVSVATGWTAGVRFPVGARCFSLAYSPPILLSNGYRGLCPPG
jgi:hypothetical protein